MNVELMRSEIMKVYPGDRWATKVNSMTLSQIVAVYNNFLATNKFKPVIMPKHLGRKEAHDMILGYDEGSNGDCTVLIIGKKNKLDGTMVISNIYYDEDATLYLEKAGAIK
jgi:hypothetical protein